MYNIAITLIKIVLVLSILTIALYTDRSCYKIKNKLTISAMIIGITFNFSIDGFPGALNSLLGILIPLITLFSLYAIQVIGAGDIKLISSIGAIMGIVFIKNASIYLLLAVIISSFIKMLIHNNFINRITYLYRYINNTICTSTINKYCTLDKEDKQNTIRLSYGITIGIIAQLIIDYGIH